MKGVVLVTLWAWVVVMVPYACIHAKYVYEGPPPRGWNSYDCYVCNVSEAQVKANALTMATTLKSSGYNYIVIDYEWFRPYDWMIDQTCCNGGWQHLTVDEYGRFIPSPDRFPSSTNGRGFKPLADYVHSLGLKFGIHILRGLPHIAGTRNMPIYNSSYYALDAANFTTWCPWCNSVIGINNKHPAGQAYYDSVVSLYASWGVDFIKMDCIAFPDDIPDVVAVRNSIEKYKREMVFSLSPGDDVFQPTVNQWKDIVSMYRITADTWDRWELLGNHFRVLPKFQQYVGKPSYPDADMLPLGWLNAQGGLLGPPRWADLTTDEIYTVMTLWSIYRNPLIIGGDLPITMNMSSTHGQFYYELFTNKEVLWMNENSKNNGMLSSSSVDLPIYMAIGPNLNGDMTTYVALFNPSEEMVSSTVYWEDLGLDPEWTCNVRHLWTHSDWPPLTGPSFTTNLRPHASLLLGFTKCQIF